VNRLNRHRHALFVMEPGLSAKAPPKGRRIGMVLLRQCI
jgi:hypothetical protein